MQAIRLPLPLLVLATALLSACGADDAQSPTSSPTSSPASTDHQPGQSTTATTGGYQTRATAAIPPGISARIQGDLEAQIRGPGIYALVPSHQDRLGYHYFSDNNPDDDYKLTIILPKPAVSGIYTLQTTDPFDIGKQFEVQLSSQQHGQFTIVTQGIITLNQLQVQSNGQVLASGTFQFNAINGEEKHIQVDGSFNFDIPAADNASSADNGDTQ